MPFTVATYNVLASAYITPEWYAGVPAHLLDPAWRVPAVARHVAALDADLLCLQEVEREVYAFFDRPPGFAIQIDPHLEYVIVSGRDGRGEYGDWGDDRTLSRSGATWSTSAKQRSA